MKLNNRFIFGLLSILLAAAIAFVALPTIARPVSYTHLDVYKRQPLAYYDLKSQSHKY